MSSEAEVNADPQSETEAAADAMTSRVFLFSASILIMQITVSITYKIGKRGVLKISCRRWNKVSASGGRDALRR